MNQTEELIRFAYFSDMEIRSDLARGYIKSENDYTSNFTGALRRNINSYSRTGLSATSLMLTPVDEQRTGTDATIIITRHGESKVALFEAKWPRISDPYFQWDYPQTANGLSHFSDQLVRQRYYKKQFAVFEMFYCEHDFGSQPPYMQQRLSSCVWHNDAHCFMNKRAKPEAVWNQDDLVTLLKAGNCGIDNILLPLCECQREAVLKMSDPKNIVHEFRLPPMVLSVCGDADKQRTGGTIDI